MIFENTLRAKTFKYRSGFGISKGKNPSSFMAVKVFTGSQAYVRGCVQWPIRRTFALTLGVTNFTTSLP